MIHRCKAALLLAAALLAFCGGSAEESEIPAPAHALPAGFCYLHEIIPDIQLDMRYAGTHNFVGDPVEAAEKLRQAADVFREMGCRILVFDAYRPQRAVKHFVRWAQDPDDLRMQAEFYPDITKKSRLLDLEYIARNSSHCRGSAIDMTLTDMEGTPLDMGTGFDYFGPLAWHGAKGITQEQAKNREMLKTVMEQCGFRCFEREWWHYKMVGEPYPDTSFDFPVK